MEKDILKLDHRLMMPCIASPLLYSVNIITEIHNLLHATAHLLVQLINMLINYVFVICM